MARSMVGKPQATAVPFLKFRISDWWMAEWINMLLMIGVGNCGGCRVSALLIWTTFVMIRLPICFYHHKRDSCGLFEGQEWHACHWPADSPCWHEVVAGLQPLHSLASQLPGLLAKSGCSTPGQGTPDSVQGLTQVSIHSHGLQLNLALPSLSSSIPICLPCGLQNSCIWQEGDSLTEIACQFPQLCKVKPLSTHTYKCTSSLS